MQLAQQVEALEASRSEEESEKKDQNVGAIYARPQRSIFKAPELNPADGSGWYVEAEWEDGTIEEIGRFASASEAWDWVARHSRDWFEERSGR